MARHFHDSVGNKHIKPVRKSSSKEWLVWWYFASSGILSLTQFAGCGQDTETLVILDPSRSSEQYVAKRLYDIHLMLDIEGGFPENYEPAIMMDVDQDKELELLLGFRWERHSRLPVFRLAPGRYENWPIAIRVQGRDNQGRVIAFGGIKPEVLFKPGELTEVTVPFNLSRELLPPQIVAVVPNASQFIPTNSISFYSSKPLNRELVKEKAKLFVVRKGAETRVAGSFEDPVDCPFGTQMWTFTAQDCEENIEQLTLRVNPGVTDESDDESLVDQEGAPGFTYTFSELTYSFFGNCQGHYNCLMQAPTRITRLDLICDLETKLFKPARCSLSPTVGSTCLGKWNSPEWVTGEAPEDCSAIREDSIWVEMGKMCLVSNPWPCHDNEDCQEIGSQSCIPPVLGSMGMDRCSAMANTDFFFSPERYVCPITEDECFPKLSGCANSCDSYGSCPEFNQTCYSPDPESVPLRCKNL